LHCGKVVRDWRAASLFEVSHRAQRHVGGIGQLLLGPVQPAAGSEDIRQINNGEQFLLVILASLSHPISRVWKGYWDRRKAPPSDEEAPT